MTHLSMRFIQQMSEVGRVDKECQKSKVLVVCKVTQQQVKQGRI